MIEGLVLFYVVLLYSALSSRNQEYRVAVLFVCILSEFLCKVIDKFVQVSHHNIGSRRVSNEFSQKLDQDLSLQLWHFYTTRTSRIRVVRSC